MWLKVGDIQDEQKFCESLQIFVNLVNTNMNVFVEIS